MSGLPRKEELKVRDDDVAAMKLAFVGLLALGCGFLTFSFQHLIKVSHEHHASLANSHYTTAYCAFAKCGEPGKQSSSSSSSSSSSRSAMAGALDDVTRTALIAERMALLETPIEKRIGGRGFGFGNQTDEMVLLDTRKALSTRVCGQPAVDGYSHVDPKCLEKSPTAQWFNQYYKLGHRQVELIAHIEAHADFDGLAVAWGIGNTKETIEECAQACLDHKPGVIKGPFENLPCNTFTWCPNEKCWEPDAHTHHKGDCWLKFTEAPAWPELNYRGKLPAAMRQRHKEAPEVAEWWGGVILPIGVQPTNGTWGARYTW